MLMCPSDNQQFTNPNCIGQSEHTCQACGVLLQWHLRDAFAGVEGADH
jgi:hypothetical protein